MRWGWGKPVSTRGGGASLYLHGGGGVGGGVEVGGRMVDQACVEQVFEATRDLVEGRFWAVCVDCGDGCGVGVVGDEF